MPAFRFNTISRIAQGVKVFLSLEGGVDRIGQRHDPRAGETKSVRRRTSEHRSKLASKKRELRQIKNEFRAAKDPTERSKHKEKMKRARQELFQLKRELPTAEDQRSERSTRLEISERRKMIESKKQEISHLRNQPSSGERGKRRKKAQQELFQLRREIRTAKDQGPEDGSETGSLPDFVIIGAQKSGTTQLYHRLTRHPHVQPAATKELHYFDNLFEEGVEWYRRCFPPPRWKDGRSTITGEATPAYIFRPQVPKRMAEVIPEARLIALLRNPVDRAYSHYHHQVRKGTEPLSFEEAIEAEQARLRGEEDEGFADGHYVGPNQRQLSYLSRGLYVDQLLRWSRFFDDEQMLVLKSEDFFERPRETLGRVLDFLDLPAWEPPALKTRNKGDYTPMAPATRRRLEEYFEPHNQRLYEYLGVDFGW